MGVRQGGKRDQLLYTPGPGLLSIKIHVPKGQINNVFIMNNYK